MTNDENTQDVEHGSQDPTPDRGPADIAPRGNPESDQETVDRGKEQLDKISGN
jgi:hypothetical protein